MFQNFIILFGLLLALVTAGLKSDTTDLDLQALIEALQEDRESGRQQSITLGKARDESNQMNIKALNLLFKNNKGHKHEVDDDNKNNAMNELMCYIAGGEGCGQDDSLDRSDVDDEDKFDEATFTQDYYRNDDDFNYNNDPLDTEAKEDLQSLIKGLEVQISGKKRKESSNTDVLQCQGSRCDLTSNSNDNDLKEYLRCKRKCSGTSELGGHEDELLCRRNCFTRSGVEEMDLRCQKKCSGRSGPEGDQILLEKYLRCRRECAIARTNHVYITVDKHHRTKTFRIPTDDNENVIDCKIKCFDTAGRIQKDFMQCAHLCMMDTIERGNTDKTRDLRCKGVRCGRTRTNSRHADSYDNLKDVLDKYGKRYRLNNNLDAVVIDVDNIGDLLDSLEITVDEGSFEDNTRTGKKRSNRLKHRLSSELVPNVPSDKRFKSIGDNTFDRKQYKALDVNQKKLSVPEFLEGVSNIRDIPLDILLKYIVDPKKNSWKRHIEQRGLSVSPENTEYLLYLRDNFQKFTDSEKAYLPILDNVLQNSIALSSLKVSPGKSLQKLHEVEKKPAIAAKVDSIEEKVPVYLWDQILSRTKLRSLLPLTQQQKLKMRIPGPKHPGDHSRHGKPRGMHGLRK